MILQHNLTKNNPFSNSCHNHNFKDNTLKLCEMISLVLPIKKKVFFVGVGVSDFMEGSAEK